MSNRNSKYFLRSIENSEIVSDSSLKEGKNNKRRLIKNINQTDLISENKFTLLKKKSETTYKEIRELQMESLLLEPLIEDSLSKNKKKESIIEELAQKSGEVTYSNKSSLICEKNSKVLQISILPKENSETDKTKFNETKIESNGNNILNIFQNLELQKKFINPITKTEDKIYDNKLKKKNLKRKTESISTSVEEEIIKKNRRKNR